MPETQQRIADPFAPGNLVRLKEPYKLMERKEALAFGITTREAWDAWPGFTHGIVAEVLERTLPYRLPGSRTARGDARRVSLHLYDPKQGRLYIHQGFTVPTYCDFHVSELRAHKIAGDEGYDTLPDVDADGEDDE